MSMCTCQGCKCDLNVRLEKRAEEERVHQFLMGLDDGSYSQIRSNIIASDPLPNMNKVYSQLVEQEQVKLMTKSSVSVNHRTNEFCDENNGCWKPRFRGGAAK